MAPRRTVFTYEDYRGLPDDGYRWEILEGCMVREPSPRPLHQFIVGNLFRILDGAAHRDRLGYVLAAPLDVILSEENVVQPDLVFVPLNRLDIIREENLRGAPALTIEVLSPSTAGRDRAVKRKIYEHFGVSEYWVVDPEHRTVERFVLTGDRYAGPMTLAGGDTLTTPLLPGLVIDVQQVFDSPLTY